MGLVALRHVESSQIRDQTRVSCIGRQKLYLWATREALPSFLLSFLLVNASWIPGNAELPSQWALVLGESHRCFQGCRAHHGLFTGLPITDPLSPILFSLFSPVMASSSANTVLHPPPQWKPNIIPFNEPDFQKPKMRQAVLWWPLLFISNSKAPEDQKNIHAWLHYGDKIKTL